MKKRIGGRSGRELRWLTGRRWLAFGGLLLLFGLASLPGAETETTAGLALDGTDASVEFDAGLSLAERSFTVEAWVWFDDLSGDKPILAQVGPDNLLHLMTRNGRPWLGFWGDDLEGATTLQTGRWYHLAFWFDASTLEQRIYVDGVLDGSRTADGPAKPDRGRLYAGEFVQLGLYSLDGRLLEMRIWDHPRDPQALAAGRFDTPDPTAPGLLALYTFEGDLSGTFADQTGTFNSNTLVGGSQVSPVRPPAALGGLIEPVPGGSLGNDLFGYTYETTPDASYPDASGTELTDGLAPPFGRGLPWSEDTPVAAETEALVGWQDQPAEITLNFDSFVNLEGLSLYAMDGDGADGVHLPDSVEVRTPGGFTDTFSIANPSGSGLLTEIALTGLDLLTDAVTVEATGPAGWILLGEVTADGTLPGPAPASDGDDLPLPAQLFLGLDPARTDGARADFRVEPASGHIDFRFPVASDTYGVEPIAQWSPDLSQWLPLPFEVEGDLGEAYARLQPPPAGGRAFFRLNFPEVAFSDDGLDGFAFEEDEAPFTGSAGSLLSGLSVTGRDPASLAIVAVGDQPALLGTPISTASGGTVTVNADGSFTYTVPDSLTEGQVLEEALTFTVADRFGNSHRRTASFEITGENDPPVAGDDTLAVTETAEAPALNYSFYHLTSGGSVDEVVDGTPVATGTTFGFNLNNRDRDDFFGFAFEGTINLPEEGDWTFYTVSDDSSTLHIGDDLVVDNQAIQSPTERSGTINLTSGPHPITVRFAQEQDGQFLAVLWEGPGTPKAPIPVSALQPVTDPTLAVPSLLANDSDIDTGETAQLVLTAVNGNAADVGEPVTLTTGTLTIAADGTGTFTPNNSVQGGEIAQETVTYTIEDPQGATATGTLTIEVTGANDAPEPLNPSFTFSEDESQPVALAQLASDPDTSDNLSITALNGTAVTAPQTVSTANGQLALLEDGSVTYTPGAPAQALTDGETLTETFTYTVTDAAGASATGTATLTIEGVNDAPNAPGLIAYQFNLPHRFEPRVLNFYGFSNVSDPETPRDQLRVTSVLGDPANVGQPVTLPSGAIVTIEENGNVTFNENNRLVGAVGLNVGTPEWVSFEGVGPGRYRTAKTDNLVPGGRRDGNARDALQLFLEITETAAADPQSGSGQRWSVRPPAGFAPSVEISLYGYFLGPAPDFPLGSGADVRIPFDATPAEVEAALEAWPEIDDVVVTGDLMSGTLEVEMVRPLDLGTASLQQPQILNIFRRATAGPNSDILTNLLLFPVPGFSLVVPFTVADPEGLETEVFLRGDITEDFFREDVLGIDFIGSTFDHSYFRIINYYSEIVLFATKINGKRETMSIDPNSEYIIETDYDAVVELILLDRAIHTRDSRPTLLPEFKDNITVEGLCTIDQNYRYAITNANEEDIVVDVQSREPLDVPADSTVEFEVEANRITVSIRGEDIGIFDANPTLCQQTFDIEVTNTFFSGSTMYVRLGNKEDESYDVKIQSTLLQTVESEPETLGEGASLLIDIDLPDLDLFRGSSFQVIVRLPDGSEQVALEFTPDWP